MCRDTILGDAVHLLGANLDLDALAGGSEHRRVERLVAVGLRDGDVVLEAVGHRLPDIVDDAERLVALRLVLDDDAEGGHVVELFELDARLLQLAEDGVVVLGPALNLGVEPLLAGELFEQRDGVADVLFALRLALRDMGDHVGVGGRVEVAERGILELDLHPVDAEPVGERRVDVERLGGDARPALVRHVVEGAEVVEPVGQLDEHHPDVARHGDDELAHVLGLRLFARLELQLGELGQAANEEGDLVSELGLDLVQRRVGVFDRVVKEGRAEAVDIELEVGGDAGNLDRVDDVGVAALALLPLMLGHRETEGAVEECEVGTGVIAPHLPHNLVIPPEHFGLHAPPHVAAQSRVDTASVWPTALGCQISFSEATRSNLRRTSSARCWVRVRPATKMARSSSKATSRSSLMMR